ncbi:hypothetical protein JCM10295v2_001792 [Rhodotorula toruloides]
MLADLDLALKRPAELVQRLYADDPSLDGFEKRVAETFSQLLSDDKAVQQIPMLTSLSTPSTLPPPGSLVRFRAMVQDTGMGSELYQAVGEGDTVFMYGADEEGMGGDPEDYSKLKERQLFYVVSVPGETEWLKENLDNASISNLQSSLDRLSLNASSSSAPAPAASKNPNPAEPHFGLVAKIYGDSGESHKTTDVCEFIGVLGETSLRNAFDELSDSASSWTSTVPALHVILTRPASKPTLPASPTEKEAREAIRKELVAYLAESLAGDSDAAEWVLLALVSRTHTRHATGMVLGSLSLNLALPDCFTTTLPDTIASLVPTSTTLDLSIASLNNQNTRLAPRSRDESLESGRLQLANGTAVVVDLRGIGEGKLEGTGVQNLRHVATTVAQQKLSYQFPFSTFELETDLNFILLSEGKAIVPSECIVYVKPATDAKASTSRPDKAKLDQLRSFISAAKYSTFDIPEGMSEVIQSDFVERRQASHGGEGMSQDDLVFRMTAARLMALSYGEKAMSKEAWLRTAELDDRRKERMPAVPQQQKGKVHGSLARAGKVKSQTPKVEPQEKKKKVTGRAKKRHLYNSRFVNVTVQPGGKGYAGGGFMMGSQGGGSQSSPGGGKRSGTSALRPVTIHQLHSATQAFAEAEFYVDNAELKDITLVACIRNISHTQTQMTMLIEDGTGQIDARMWKDPNAEETGQDEYQLNTYVRIIGALKTFSNKRHVSANRVRPIEDFNEILFHPIECIYVHKYYTEGPPGGDAGGTHAITHTTYDSGANPYAGGGGLATPHDDIYADLPSGQRTIMTTIAQQVNSGQSGEEGVNINAVIRAIGGNPSAIRNDIETLVGDGHLYQTIDDDQ